MHFSSEYNQLDLFMFPSSRHGYIADMNSTMIIIPVNLCNYGLIYQKMVFWKIFVP